MSVACVLLMRCVRWLQTKFRPYESINAYNHSKSFNNGSLSFNVDPRRSYESRRCRPPLHFKWERHDGTDDDVSSVADDDVSDVAEESKNTPSVVADEAADEAAEEAANKAISTMLEKDIAMRWCPVMGQYLYVLYAIVKP